MAPDPLSDPPQEVLQFIRRGHPAAVLCADGRARPRRTSAPGGCVFRIEAPASARPIPFRVFLDGQTADGAAGTDVAADGHGTVTDQRCYQLIRKRGHRFEIEFLDAGVEAYCFTFG